MAKHTNGRAVTMPTGETLSTTRDQDGGWVWSIARGDLFKSEAMIARSARLTYGRERGAWVAARAVYDRAAADAKRRAVEHARREARADSPGCGDNSCLVAKPRGMATNGGCRCEAPALRRALATMRADLADAAGGLRIPIPQPGTDVARLLVANKLMRDGLRNAERRELAALADLDEVRVERDSLLEWKRQAIEAISSSNLGKLQGHPVADKIAALREAIRDLQR